MIGGYLEPNQYWDIRGISIGSASMLIVGLMILLMMTGMPLGIVTMFVSILTALMFFGYGILATTMYAITLGFMDWRISQSWC